MRIKVRVGYDEEGRFATFEGNEDDVAEVLTWLLCDLGARDLAETAAVSSDELACNSTTNDRLAQSGAILS